MEGYEPKGILQKVKRFFSGFLYNYSGTEQENQMNDRLSFQRIAGINFTRVYQVSLPCGGLRNC
jgi:hypothetical protein